MFRIDNDPRPYSWGMQDGIAQLLGRPPTGGPEAELWLGSHRGSSSRLLGDAPWADLAAWEEATGQHLPYLLKFLAAGSSLSLQAHPSAEQAAAGFRREEAAGIPLTARWRNYKDPAAKPEIVVAAADGFSGLCGFRPVPDTLAVIERLAARASGPASFDQWRSTVATRGLREATAWILSGDPAVDALLAATVTAAAQDPCLQQLHQLDQEHPGDPGILVAVMLNHVRLAAGEALWLPAGNIHAHLHGVAVELMGPSDNVLRGGLTGKHVDVPELLQVLDFTGGEPSRLAPVELAPKAVSYRPDGLPGGVSAGFELVAITGPVRLSTQAPTVLAVLDGSFAVDPGEAAGQLSRGQFAFSASPGRLEVSGSGRLFAASAGVSVL